MGSVGGESHGGGGGVEAVVVAQEVSLAGKESSEEPVCLPDAESREHPSVDVAEDSHPHKREDALDDEAHNVEKLENAPVEVSEDLHVIEIREDALVDANEDPRFPERREDASVEVTEEPQIMEKREDAANGEPPGLEKREDALVEPRFPETETDDKRQIPSVDVIEKPHLPEAEIREVASVEVTQEPCLPEFETRVAEEPGLEKRELDASVDALEQKVLEVMGAGMDDNLDNGVGTSSEAGATGNNAGVQELVPSPKRKLPSVQRFSARRSAVADGRTRKDDMFVRNKDPPPEPPAMRKQRGAHRLSARMGMGVDDRDTVDYGTINDPVSKPAVAAQGPVPRKTVLTVAEREQLRLQNIKRNKEIVCLERIRGKLVNITAGLELHTGVFSRVEQKKLVDLVRDLQAKGRCNELKDRTYSEPKKWMRGKGRVTMQFGCCYNYAVDEDGNFPGILREEVVDPMPPLLRATIKRLVRWHVMPPTCVPDSCIINMYEEGDCIPPHIDHHDFLRPFCTLSLVSECNIVFGANLEVLGPGDFSGTISIPLPVGSVLVLNGNGADVAKHAVPAVPTERISITFRKMDPAKVPRGFIIDRELQNLRSVMLPAAPQVDTDS